LQRSPKNMKATCRLQRKHIKMWFSIDKKVPTASQHEFIYSMHFSNAVSYPNIFLISNSAKKSSQPIWRLTKQIWRLFLQKWHFLRIKVAKLQIKSLAFEYSGIGSPTELRTSQLRMTQFERLNFERPNFERLYFEFEDSTSKRTQLRTTQLRATELRKGLNFERPNFERLNFEKYSTSNLELRTSKNF
jgi:hypothetical protein